MAGACSCESCCGKACGRFEALSGACSCESCLGKACGKLREWPWKGLQKGLRVLKGLRAGKRQSVERLAEGLKHCLGHVAARVALEMRAGSCKSCLGKARGRV